ncbi:MAG: hypothetical protein IPI02_18575 [Sterolibacteriaceae bacterium]|nr:hypothetical protein [Sterolibacteriaceae bacterium]
MSAKLGATGLRWKRAKPPGGGPERRDQGPAAGSRYRQRIARVLAQRVERERIGQEQAHARDLLADAKAAQARIQVSNARPGKPRSPPKI